MPMTSIHFNSSFPCPRCSGTSGQAVHCEKGHVGCTRCVGPGAWAEVGGFLTGCKVCRGGSQKIYNIYISQKDSLK